MQLAGVVSDCERANTTSEAKGFQGCAAVPVRLFSMYVVRYQTESHPRSRPPLKKISTYHLVLSPCHHGNVLPPTAPRPPLRQQYRSITTSSLLVTNLVQSTHSLSRVIIVVIIIIVMHHLLPTNHPSSLPLPPLHAAPPLPRRNPPSKHRHLCPH